VVFDEIIGPRVVELAVSLFQLGESRLTLEQGTKRIFDAEAVVGDTEFVFDFA
jgi:hypothetical protein